MQIPQASIPSAGLFDVLEHIEDDKAALEGLHRSITPGGRLYLAVPAFQKLWARDDIEAGHFRRYTKKSLTAVVEEAGFEVERVTYFFSVLVLPVFLLRALPYRLKLDRPRAPGDTGAAAHSLPDNAAGRFIARMLDRERRAIEQGRGPSFGTSIMLAARRR
jgi:SAM-dependent methyltransferase